MAKVLSIRRGACAKLHLEYEHDGKRCQSFPRTGAKSCKSNIEYYIQIPMSNDGYVYRKMPVSDVLLRPIVLVWETNKHPDRIRGLLSLDSSKASTSPILTFACRWFQCRKQAIQQGAFYSGSADCVNVVMERRDYPRQGDTVSITLCFEPGWPIEDFSSMLDDVGDEEIEELEGIDG